MEGLPTHFGVCYIVQCLRKDSFTPTFCKGVASATCLPLPLPLPIHSYPYVQYVSLIRAGEETRRDKERTLLIIAKLPRLLLLFCLPSENVQHEASTLITHKQSPKEASRRKPLLKGNQKIEAAVLNISAGQDNYCSNKTEMLAQATEKVR